MRISWLLLATLALTGCTVQSNASNDDDDETPGPTGLPVLGNGTHDVNEVNVEIIATADDRLNEPRDVALNPMVPGQVWIINTADNSTVVLHDAGLPEQTSERHNSFGSDHFLASPGGIAFSDHGFFATSQDTADITQLDTPANFMGPTLWVADFEIYDAGHLGHMDMLHNSPLGAGIAWERDNVYWVFDGYHSSLTRYDFVADHGPGNTDHSDGIIHRYVEGEVTRIDGAVSNMFYDQAESKLYVADTGNSRIAVLDTAAGVPGSGLAPNYDGCTMMRYEGAMTQTLINTIEFGFGRPTGLATHNNLIYIADWELSNLYAFTYAGELVDYLETGLPPYSLNGITVDPEGRIYFTDTLGNQLLRVSAK